MKEISLTPLELSTLVALARLGGDGYAVPIREDIRSFGGRDVSIATIYAALERLHRLGFARPWLSAPRPERGGRARRHYSLTPSGRERIRLEHAQVVRLWQGVAMDSGGDS